MADEEHRGLAARIAEIMRAELRLTSTGGEPCGQCGDTVDYSFKIKDGCVDKCAAAISEFVFEAMVRGDISVTATSPALPAAQG